MQRKISLQETLHKNHEKTNQEFREKVRRYLELQKKQQRREKILFYFIAAFIITISSVCILLIDKQNKEFVQTCTGKGYSVNYCMDHM